MLFKSTILLTLATSIFAIDSIETKGNAFFAGSNRFYIRGLDYQPGGSSNLIDPLADPKTCERDIKYFKDLGINTIRVYSVDNTADHDECMEKLSDAGIYVIVDTNIPNASIARDDGECLYNTMYLNEVFATVKMMAKYDNTLGFFAANEVINDDKSTEAATYVKAVVRDMKTFMKNTGLRQVPVGYSAADVLENRLETAQYFNCGDDEMARSDMFGFNDYSWCGKLSFLTSGYDQKVKDYSNYSIPIFMSEFGCNKVTPRPFTEISSIYSSDMSGVFSGGLVYEYSQEDSNYGLVKISLDNTTVLTLKDYDNLKNAYKSQKNPDGDGGYQSDLPHAKCPEINDKWNATDKLPDTPKGALKYLNGKEDPSGNGFDALTQWACVAKGNNVDDSGGSSIHSRSSTRSGSSSTGSASGSSSSSSGSSSGNSSSSKKSEGVVGVSVGSWVAMAGVVVGMALI